MPWIKKELEEFLLGASGRLIEELKSKQDEILTCDYWEKVQDPINEKKKPIFYGYEDIPTGLKSMRSGIMLYIKAAPTKTERWELSACAYHFDYGIKITQILRSGLREELLAELDTKELKDEFDNVLQQITDDLDHLP